MYLNTSALIHVVFTGENKLRIDIDWSVVFKRNLVQIQECKLREFDFKMWYNIILSLSLSLSHTKLNTKKHILHFSSCITTGQCLLKLNT